MNTSFRIGLGLFLSAVCVSWAEEQVVRVDTSRELRLAVVDNAKSSPSRDAVYAAFAETLSETISARYQSHVGVRAKRVSADHAAFNLGTGVYDAVLVFGNSLPRPLMISDVARLHATLGSGKTETKVYLIFGTADETLGKLLAVSFEGALTADKFLAAYEGPAAKIGDAPNLAAVQ